MQLITRSYAQCVVQTQSFTFIWLNCVSRYIKPDTRWIIHSLLTDSFVHTLISYYVFLFISHGAANVFIVYDTHYHFRSFVRNDMRSVDKRSLDIYTVAVAIVILWPVRAHIHSHTYKQMSYSWINIYIYA